MKLLQGFVVSALLLGASAFGAPIQYRASLSGLNENPANASPGYGTAKVTFDIDTHTLTVDVIFLDLVGTTMMAHIHCCVDAPGNVGVATPTPSFPGFPIGVMSGSYFAVFDTTMASSFNPSFVTNNGGVAGAEAALAAGLAGGQSYLNIHTETYRGGEIRGFLVAVPEPGTFGLVGAVLAGAIWLRRRS